MFERHGIQEPCSPLFFRPQQRHHTLGGKVHGARCRALALRAKAVLGCRGRPFSKGIRGRHPWEIFENLCPNLRMLEYFDYNKTYPTYPSSLEKLLFLWLPNSNGNIVNRVALHFPLNHSGTPSTLSGLNLLIDHDSNLKHIARCVIVKVGGFDIFFINSLWSRLIAFEWPGC